MNWSGGKDSALSLYKVLQDQQLRVDALLTNVNAAHDRISMHGVRRELLTEQARSIGISLQTIELPEHPAMATYESAMAKSLTQLKSEGYSTAIFGDIFLEDLKNYRQQKLQEEGIDCVFPLWQIDSRTIMEDFLRLGFKAIIVCVNEQYLNKSFCGRYLNQSFVDDLPPGVDLCGENGEYHSFVFDGPIFSYPVAFNIGNIVRKTYPAPQVSDTGGVPHTPVADYGFYFCDLLNQKGHL